MSENDDTPTNDADARDGQTAGGDDALPPSVVDEAERLTRLAREAVDENEAAAYRERREALVGEHGYEARVRTDGTETLVCYPTEWLDDGVVRTDRIEDTGRAVEVSLSGPGDPDEWRDVDDHNREIVERVRAEHGEIHARNATAFADFAGNHYAKPVESVTAAEITEFLEWYFPRNAWPSEEQSAVVEQSLQYVFETAGKRMPGP